MNNTHIEDSINMALLWTNNILDTNIIAKDTIMKFDQTLNNNLEKLYPNFKIAEEPYLNMYVYNLGKDQKDRVYYLLKADLNYHDLWQECLQKLPKELICASMEVNTLNILGINPAKQKTYTKNGKGWI
jgi:hypothetical protein